MKEELYGRKGDSDKRASGTNGRKHKRRFLPLTVQKRGELHRHHAADQGRFRHCAAMQLCRVGGGGDHKGHGHGAAARAADRGREAGRHTLAECSRECRRGGKNGMDAQCVALGLQPDRDKFGGAPRAIRHPFHGGARTAGARVRVHGLATNRRQMALFAARQRYIRGVPWWQATQLLFGNGRE